MNLVIVESPTKSKTIAKYLGSDYQVLSSFGHIRDLPKSELGVDVDKNFDVTYIIPTKARKAVAALKKAAAKAKKIILATDEDREGEAIAWHILHALKITDKNKYERIVFHEITKKAILNAIANPRRLNDALIDAQQARRVLDRLVGYKLSPFLWKKVARGLSAGRVQSVAVRLIVDRERERLAFKPDEYWSLEALLKKSPPAGGEFTARLVKKDNKTIDKLGIKNKQEADAIVKDLTGADYKVAEVAKKETKKNPLPPFMTSTLQQAAVQRFGFSAKRTMRLAQQLYEGVRLGTKGPTGLITYHRTDSLNLSQDAINKAADFITEKYGAKYLQTRNFKTKSKGAQEAHEAIRATSARRHPDLVKKYLDPRQLKLYSLIWQRYIASQMAPAILDTVTADISAKNYTWRANGSTIKFDGFLKVYPVKTQEVILPDLSKGDLLELLKLLTEQHFTQPPARYSEASLVKALEAHGIGRPSTYAPIISTIQARNYVEKDDQKKFLPTEMGYIVTDIMLENFQEIVDVKFTAYMEEDLDKVAMGKMNWVTVVRNFYEPFAENLAKKYDSVEKKNMDVATDKKCPDCGKDIVIKMGRFGKFYACTGFPECKHTEPIINKTGVKCPKCQEGDLVEKKTKRGRTFYACNKYPKCEYALWDKPVDQVCPKCKSQLVEKNKEIKCSNKECDYQTDNN